jgi:hypothetical protein
MKRCNSLILLLSTLSIRLFAQQNSLTFKDLGNLHTNEFGGGGKMIRVDNTSNNKLIEGDYFYIDSIFREGIIVFKESSKQYGPLPIRYNLKSNELEVRTSQGVRAFSTELASFNWIDPKSSSDSKFINADDYSYKNFRLVGFLEILGGSKYLLVKQKKVVYIKGEYHPLKGADSGNDKILKQQKYLILFNNRILDIPRKKSDFFEIFGAHSHLVKQYSSSNKLSLKDEGSLIKIITYANSL